MFSGLQPPFIPPQVLEWQKPIPWVRLRNRPPATWEAGDQATLSGEGYYIFYDSQTRRVMYVGQTTDLKKRFENYQKAYYRGKRLRFGAYLNLVDPSLIWVYICRLKGRNPETFLIDLYNPIYNKNLRTGDTEMDD